MTVQRKKELIKALNDLLEAIIEIEEPQPMNNSKEDSQPEMLTIKECSQVFKGISEHAIRKLVAQEKIPYIRIGESKRAKILIPRAEFENFLKTSM